jgi:hypothetical protein
MLTEEQAQAQLEKTLPEVPIKAWARYDDLYLFRVEHPSSLEADWDPFFSVDSFSGEVRDFSVLTDGDISEIAALEWNTL